MYPLLITKQTKLDKHLPQYKGYSPLKLQIDINVQPFHVYIIVL